MADSSGPIEAEAEAIPPPAPAVARPSIWEKMDPRKWKAPENFRIWGITDVVGISDNAWGKLSWIATGIGAVAITTNFGMVVAYAAGVAKDAPLLADAGKDWIKGAVNLLIGTGQVFVAGMLQLGTDFCLLYAAGLAKSKYRFTPLAAMILWAICAANTLEMKKDIYESIKQGRIEQARIAEEAAAPANVVQARKALEPFNTKPAQKPIPPELDASSAVIETSGQTVVDLQAERVEKVAAREEEVKTGRKERWEANDLRVREIDTKLVEERNKVAAARVALADRKAYEANVKTVNDWDTRPKIEASTMGFDHDWAIGLRVWGMSLLSFVSILVAFAADKAADDMRKAAEEKRKRSEAGYKGAENRKAKGKVVEGEFTESASTEAKGLPFDPAATPGATSPAHTKSPPKTHHPDKEGDGEVKAWTDIDMTGGEGRDD